MSIYDKNYSSALFAVTTQVAANAVQRQVLANFRLGVNTGENWKHLIGRFGASPLTLVSGVAHRLSLQFLTQGMPMLYNRTNDTSQRSSMSPFMTAVWMSTVGCIFEVSGLKQPIQDKATSHKLGDINFWGKAHRVGGCIIPIVLFRNSIYTKVVFGLDKNDPFWKRMCIVTIAGICTNPVDSAVNIVAYETAIASKETPLYKIYLKTWNQFIGDHLKGQGVTRLRWVIAHAMSGVEYRIVGVGGAAIILSSQTGDALQEMFR